MVFDGCERSMIEEKNIKRVFLRIFFSTERITLTLKNWHVLFYSACYIILQCLLSICMKHQFLKIFTSLVEALIISFLFSLVNYSVKISRCIICCLEEVENTLTCYWSRASSKICLSLHQGFHHNLIVV